jgi:hypothetical protein
MTAVAKAMAVRRSFTRRRKARDYVHVESAMVGQSSVADHHIADYLDSP